MISDNLDNLHDKTIILNDLDSSFNSDDESSDDLNGTKFYLNDSKLDSSDSDGPNSDLNDIKKTLTEPGDSLKNKADPALIEIFKEKAKGRKPLWDSLFDRFDVDDEDEGVDICDFVSTSQTTPPHYSNKLKNKDLTAEQLLIVDAIENKLQSSLHKKVLKREKAKFFDMYDMEKYDAIHDEFKTEFRRIRNGVNGFSIVQEYLRLVFTEDKEISEKIIAFSDSNFVELLLYLDKIRKHPPDDSVSKRKVVEFKREWNHLRTIIPEEDIIIFCVCFLKSQ